MKPTQRQRQVLLLMKHGWSLCYTGGYTYRAWLQENGCGRGGETQRVNTNTFWAISGRDWIKENRRNYPTTSYGITTRGLEALQKSEQESTG